MSNSENDDMREEYDLSKLKQSGPRGKYAKMYKEASNIVVIDEDLTENFPSAKAVNDALRKLLKKQDNSAA